jgi:hypothetical protein
MGSYEGDNRRNQKHTREQLLRRTVNAAAYIREHPEMMQRAVNFWLHQARSCIENRGGHFEKLT